MPCSLSESDVRRCCGHAGVSEEGRMLLKPVESLDQDSIDLRLCMFHNGGCVDDPDSEVVQVMLLVWKRYHATGFQRRSREAVISRRQDAVDWFWQQPAIVFFHDAGGAVSSERDFGLLSTACISDGFFCPPSLPLAVTAFKKAGSSSVARWVASLCDVDGHPSWTLSDVWLELGKRWPLGTESSEAIAYAVQDILSNLNSSYIRANRSRADMVNIAKSAVVAAGMDVNEPVANTYMRQLTPDDARRVSQPVALHLWGLPCCRFGTARCHLIVVRNPFVRFVSLFRHDNGGGSPSLFRQLTMRYLNSSNVDWMHVHVRRLLDVGDEVRDQGSLFASRGSLLIHLETVREDLRHAQSCLCLMYGACLNLPPFPSVNQERTRTSQRKFKLASYWTRDLLSTFLAAGGVEEFQFLGYSTSPHVHHPREKLRLCG